MLASEVEEVTSQATLEMSVEDEEDPFAEEKKGVLHELEVVANEKDAKHALMQKLKLQIRQLEVSNVRQQLLFLVWDCNWKHPQSHHQIQFCPSLDLAVSLAINAINAHPVSFIPRRS